MEKKMICTVKSDSNFEYDDEEPVLFLPNADVPEKVVFRPRLKDGKSFATNEDKVINLSLSFNEWKAELERRGLKIVRKGDLYCVK